MTNFPILAKLKNVKLFGENSLKLENLFRIRKDTVFSRWVRKKKLQKRTVGTIFSASDRNFFFRQNFQNRKFAHKSASPKTRAQPPFWQSTRRFWPK